MSATASSACVGVAVAVFLVTGCDSASNACRDADVLYHRSEYQSAVARANVCLASNDLDDRSKLLGYRARALANYKLANYQQAASDQMEVVSLPNSVDQDLCNSALYLRLAGHTRESLEMALRAEQRDHAAHRVWMMTQYQLGWSYLELGEYQNAIDAFTKGIPAQRDYAYVYWQRGLAYHRLHRSDEAKQDFEQFVELIKAQRSDLELPSDIAQVRETLAMYNLGDPFTGAVQ